MGRETKEVGAMSTCYCLTFVSFKPCLLNFQRFESCVSWTPFCIFSFCYFSYAVVSGTYPWVYLRHIKSDYHGWLSMMTSSGRPSFLSCLGLPQPSTHHCSCYFVFTRKLLRLVFCFARKGWQTFWPIVFRQLSVSHSKITLQIKHTSICMIWRSIVSLYAWLHFCTVTWMICTVLWFCIESAM